METFIIYLAKASGLTVVFFLAYTTLLKKETFFTPNRMFLLAGLFTSALMPLLVYTKIVWVTPEPVIAMPMQHIDVNNLIATPPQVVVPEAFTINWFYVALAAYAAGFLFFMVHFLTDLYKVSRMLRNQKVIVKDGFKHIDSTSIQSPFSFFKYIVYNSASLYTQELNDIIAHEKVHSSQKHSLDVLISQLFCIVFWFNPFAWLYKKAISQNLEFIADAVATKHVADRKSYQKTLLKITVQPECIAITNHFYQSLIKKRIVMLNKQQSKKRNFYKYALIAPALIAFIVLFQVEVIAQEKEPVAKQNSVSTKSFKDLRVIMDVTKDAKDEELKNETAIFKQEFDADVTFTNIKRNSKGEITAIKVMVKEKGNQPNYPVYEVTSTGSTPIQPFTVDIHKDETTGKNVINFGQPKSVVKVSRHLTSAKDGDSIYYGTAVITQDDKALPAKALYIVDGIPREASSNSLGDVDPNTIEKIEVLKDEAKLVKLYGKRAKNGVILITTKRGIAYGTAVHAGEGNLGNTLEKTDNSTTQNVTIQAYTASATYKVNGLEDNLKNIMENDKIDYKKAVIRINGKEATPDELEKLKPKKIASSILIPGTARLTDKYGEKAANGVIIVELKGFKSEIYPSNEIPKDRTKLDAELEANTGYIIHKRTDKKAIRFYTKELKEKGLEVKIKTLERNKEGIITSIEVELVDTRTGKIQTGGNSNSKGILDMYVGLKGGEPALYSMGK